MSTQLPNYKVYVLIKRSLGVGYETRNTHRNAITIRRALDSGIEQGIATIVRTRQPTLFLTLKTMLTGTH